MPYVEVDISGLTCGDSVSVYITMTWADPATGFVTSWESPSATLTAGTSGFVSVYFEGESGWALATYEHSGDESEGGEATVLWSVNGTGEPDYNFPIQGDEDPSSSKTMVDNFYNNNQFYNNGGTLVSVPWFWGNILDWESTGGRQYASVPGNPLVAANPDGIGISQIDGTQNVVYDIDYWNFEANIEDGFMVLSGKATESENNWLAQYKTDSNYTAVSGDQSYTNCSFQTSMQPLGDHSYGDADWIQDYNTHSDKHWYLWWTGAKWEFKWQTSEAGHNYVPDVCNAASY